MTTNEPDSEVKVARRQQRLASGFVGALGVLALLVPLWPELAPERRLGGLLLAAATLELFDGLRRADPQERRAAWFSGLISLALGLLLLNASLLLRGMLVYGLAGWLALDGIRHRARGGLRGGGPGDVGSRCAVPAAGGDHSDEREAQGQRGGAHSSLPRSRDVSGTAGSVTVGVPRASGNRLAG